MRLAHATCDEREGYRHACGYSRAGLATELHGCDALTVSGNAKLYSKPCLYIAGAAKSEKRQCRAIPERLSIYGTRDGGDRRTRLTSLHLATQAREETHSCRPPDLRVRNGEDMMKNTVGHQDRSLSCVQMARKESLTPPSGTPYWTSREIAESGSLNLPRWAAESLASFRQNILAPTFPCMFATSSEQQNRLVYSFLNTATEIKDVDIIAQAICRYLSDIAKLPQEEADLTVLIVFIKPVPDIKLRDYGATAQALLQLLHERDVAPWPSGIPTKEDHPLWSFAFAGRPLFINISTPANRARLSRNVGPSMTLIISPLDVFDRVAGSNAKGRRIRDTIRSRAQKYDRGLPFAPWSSFAYGQGTIGTERSQYILPDDNDEPISLSIRQCPFRSRT
jgi:uncharacterized protein